MLRGRAHPNNAASHRLTTPYTGAHPQPRWQAIIHPPRPGETPPGEPRLTPRLCWWAGFLGPDFDVEQLVGLLALGQTTIGLDEGSRVSGTLPDAALGGGVGVAMLPKDDGDQPALSVQGATLEGHELAAVLLAGAGSYLIEDSVLEGGVGQGYLSWPAGNAVFATEGVEAWDEERGLLLRANTLRGAGSAALVLDRASATLSGNTWEDNALDLVQQGCGAVSSPPPGAEEATKAEICPEYDRPVDPPDWYQYEARIEVAM